MQEPTQRQRRLIATLVPAAGCDCTPVQVQKLTFLLDREIDGDGWPLWDHQPYDYGPFDEVVYEELEVLEELGLVTINRPKDGLRSYRLTSAGQAIGRDELEQLEQTTRSTISKLCEWVCSQTFEKLIRSVYERFPEMAVRSVFKPREGE